MALNCATKEHRSGGGNQQD